MQETLAKPWWVKMFPCVPDMWNCPCLVESLVVRMCGLAFKCLKDHISQYEHRQIAPQQTQGHWLNQTSKVWNPIFMAFNTLRWTFNILAHLENGDPTVKQLLGKCPCPTRWGSCPSSSSTLSLLPWLNSISSPFFTLHRLQYFSLMSM